MNIKVARTYFFFRKIAIPSTFFYSIHWIFLNLKLLRSIQALLFSVHLWAKVNFSGNYSACENKRYGMKNIFKCTLAQKLTSFQKQKIIILLY